MTAAMQEPLDFDTVSEPVSGDTKATVELVANDWMAEPDWQTFKGACRSVASTSPDKVTVDPNRVRVFLTGPHGLTIEPRRYSAFWARATGKHGFLDNDGGWVINDDHAGGNAGKPIRRRRLRAAS